MGRWRRAGRAQYTVGRNGGAQRHGQVPSLVRSSVTAAALPARVGLRKGGGGLTQRFRRSQVALRREKSHRANAAPGVKPTAHPDPRGSCSWRGEQRMAADFDQSFAGCAEASVFNDDRFTRMVVAATPSAGRSSAAPIGHPEPGMDPATMSRVFCA